MQPGAEVHGEVGPGARSPVRGFAALAVFGLAGVAWAYHWLDRSAPDIDAIWRKPRRNSWRGVLTASRPPWTGSAGFDPPHRSTTCCGPSTQPRVTSRIKPSPSSS